MVDLVVLACVLRATTKKGHQLFRLAPKYFPVEPPLSFSFKRFRLHNSQRIAVSFERIANSI